MTVQRTLGFLVAERDVIKYRLHRIRAAVNKITNQQLKDIITRHYFDGWSIKDIAEESFLTENAVYKRINRLFSHDTE